MAWGNVVSDRGAKVAGLHQGCQHKPDDEGRRDRKQPVVGAPCSRPKWGLEDHGRRSRKAPGTAALIAAGGRCRSAPDGAGHVVRMGHSSFSVRSDAKPLP